MIGESGALGLDRGLLGQLGHHDFDGLVELRVLPLADQGGVVLDLDIRGDAPFSAIQPSLGLQTPELGAVT